MTKYMVTIEIKDPPKGFDLGTLLRDALHEFVMTRTPSSDYVDRRYADTSTTIIRAARARKIAEVEGRCKVAEELWPRLQVVDMSHGPSVLHTMASILEESIRASKPSKFLALKNIKDMMGLAAKMETEVERGQRCRYCGYLYAPGMERGSAPCPSCGEPT